MRPAAGQLLHHLELEQVELAIEINDHVYATMMASVLHGNRQSQCGEVAIENASIMTFIAGNRVIAIPVVGQASLERLEVNLQAGEVMVL